MPAIPSPAPRPWRVRCLRAGQAAREGEDAGQDRSSSGSKAIKAKGKGMPMGDIRGLGAMLAFELVTEHGGNKPDAAGAKALAAKCLERGLLILTCGVYGDTIRLLTPLTASRRSSTKASTSSKPRSWGIDLSTHPIVIAGLVPATHGAAPHTRVASNGSPGQARDDNELVTGAMHDQTTLQHGRPRYRDGDPSLYQSRQASRRRARSSSTRGAASISMTTRASAISRAWRACGARRSATATRNSSRRRRNAMRKLSYTQHLLRQVA